MSIVLRFFPNGEFSQGVNATSQRRDKRRHPLEGYEKRRDDAGRLSISFQGRNAEIPEATLNLFLGRKYISPRQNTYEVVEAGQLHCVLKWYDDENVSHLTSVQLNIIRVIHEWKLIELGSSDARILTEPPKSRKKCESMTKNMARNIRNGVYLLEEKYGKDNLSFLTLTLPNLSAEGLASCCANWDTMTHNFLKWLRTKADKHGYSIEYVYCTEIQEKRFTNRGEYAPHLHVVFRGRIGRKSNWIITPKMARKEWARQIKSCTSEFFTTSALENIRRIKKSAARYLGKYMSKNSNCVPQGDRERFTALLHTQWGGMSRQTSRDIRKNTIRLESTGESGTFVGCFLGSIQGLFERGIVKYYKCGFIPIGKCESGGKQHCLKVMVGCLGRPLSKGIIEDCMKAIEILYESEEITYC